MTDGKLAIEYLNELKEKYTDGEGFDKHPLPEYYAIEDGIEALHKVLEQQSCPYWDYGLKTCRHANIGALATKPYGDAISRVEVIDELNRLGRNAFKEDTDYDNFFSFLDGLPPATPIRPKGKWETGYTYPDGEYWKCSVCKELIRVRIPMHFCPNCSADMRGEKDAT